MALPLQPIRTLNRARELRRRLTLPEVLIWARLRPRAPGRPIFRRQHPLGPYVLDFYCEQARLCIEVDGAGHGDPHQMFGDDRRDAWLAANGVRVIRVPAAYVLEDPDRAAEWLINEALDADR